MLEDPKPLIYIANDHAGYQHKNLVKSLLDEEKYEVVDLGVFDEESADYPERGRELGEKMHENPKARGIAICGSGIGICMAVNKMKGSRGVLATNPEMAELARVHNNANVLCLAGREGAMDEATLKATLEKFLDTPFEEDQERRVRRVKQLNEM